jgi:hypothetical protein
MAENDFIQFEDYYLEDGRIIFTEKYLRKKGVCCGNKCRHCPYDPPQEEGNTELKK